MRSPITPGAVAPKPTSPIVRAAGLPPSNILIAVSDPLANVPGIEPPSRAEALVMLRVTGYMDFKTCNG